jgi:hypothetical protein
LGSGAAAGTPGSAAKEGGATEGRPAGSSPSDGSEKGSESSSPEGPKSNGSAPVSIPGFDTGTQTATSPNTTYGFKTPSKDEQESAPEADIFANRPENANAGAARRWRELAARSVGGSGLPFL